VNASQIREFAKSIRARAVDYSLLAHSDEVCEYFEIFPFYLCGFRRCSRDRRLVNGTVDRLIKIWFTVVFFQRYTFTYATYLQYPWSEIVVIRMFPQYTRTQTHAHARRRAGAFTCCHVILKNELLRKGSTERLYVYTHTHTYTQRIYHTPGYVYRCLYTQVHKRARGGWRLDNGILVSRWSLKERRRRVMYSNRVNELMA